VGTTDAESKFFFDLNHEQEPDEPAGQSADSSIPTAVSTMTATTYTAHQSLIPR
jgi:hypothetical protein